MEKEVKYIDLFAGLGGIRLGFSGGLKAQGIESRCVFSSEVKDHAIKAYNGYFGQETIHGDITKIESGEIPDFDFLLAGFPCQPFSSAGQRLGFADTRGTLFFEIERILKSKIDNGTPAEGFLLENVEGLINHDDGKTLATILRHLENLGYNISYRLLDSRHFGLAQSRKRVYLTGMLHHAALDLSSFEEHTAVLKDILEHGLPTINDKFTKLLLKNHKMDELAGKSINDKRGGDGNIHSWDIELKGPTTKQQRTLLNAMLRERRRKKWAEEAGIKWMDGMPLTEGQIRTFFDVPNLHDMLADLEQKGYLAYEHPKGAVNGRRVPDETKPRGYNIVAGKLSFEFSRILDPDGLAPALVATDVARLGVMDGDGIRHLTIRECQRLCGYPEDYDLSIVKTEEAFDLLGNTVCVPVIQAISERMGMAWKNCVD